MEYDQEFQAESERKLRFLVSCLFVPDSSHCLAFVSTRTLWDYKHQVIFVGHLWRENGHEEDEQKHKVSCSEESCSVSVAG